MIGMKVSIIVFATVYRLSGVYCSTSGGYDWNKAGSGRLLGDAPQEESAKPECTVNDVVNDRLEDIFENGCASVIREAIYRIVDESIDKHLIAIRNSLRPIIEEEAKNIKNGTSNGVAQAFYSPDRSAILLFDSSKFTNKLGMFNEIYKKIKEYADDGFEATRALVTKDYDEETAKLKLYEHLNAVENLVIELEDTSKKFIAEIERMVIEELIRSHLSNKFIDFLMLVYSAIKRLETKFMEQACSSENSHDLLEMLRREKDLFDLMVAELDLSCFTGDKDIPENAKIRNLFDFLYHTLFHTSKLPLDDIINSYQRINEISMTIMAPFVKEGDSKGIPSSSPSFARNATDLSALRDMVYVCRQNTTEIFTNLPRRYNFLINESQTVNRFLRDMDIFFNNLFIVVEETKGYLNCQDHRISFMFSIMNAMELFIRTIQSLPTYQE